MCSLGGRRYTNVYRVDAGDDSSKISEDISLKICFFIWFEKSTRARKATLDALAKAP